jgi:hypothetical protein
VPEHRLHIEPHNGPGGNFAIWDGDELKGVGSRAEVEEAKGRWQSQIDAGGEPDTFIGGLMIDEAAREANAKLEERLAAIENLHPAKTGAKGWEERQKRRLEDEAEKEKALLAYVAGHKANTLKELAALGHHAPTQGKIVSRMISRWKFPWRVRKKNSTEFADRPCPTTLIKLLTKIKI